MSATKTKSTFNDSLTSLRRALRPFTSVTVRAGVDDDLIILDLNEDADDNDRTKANLMERGGWEGWPVKAEGPGMNRDLARRRWG